MKNDNMTGAFIAMVTISIQKYICEERTRKIITINKETGLYGMLYE